MFKRMRSVSVDYLVVGSGLTGATIARSLYDEGCEILVIDRRNHVGGNVFDYKHKSGINIHAYGPHYFRTSSEQLWKHVNRFAEFYLYEAVVRALVDGREENWPISQEYIERTVGKDWNEKIASFKEPHTFEDACLGMMPKKIYEKFIVGYSQKQWGVAPQKLSAVLAGRFCIRLDNDPRLKKSKYQGIPKQGYCQFMKNMLSGIPLHLGVDYLREKKYYNYKKGLIFTGPIDEYFKFCLGRLAYRSQKRTHKYYKKLKYYQSCGQINNSSLKTGPHIRTIEWKHMMPKKICSKIQGTVITRETPFTSNYPNQFEYPFIDDSNLDLYKEYRVLADKLPNIYICGRLGQYQYFDMDQAIANALGLSRKILETFKS